MRNNCARKFYAQYLRKLGRSFVNAQYMRNICARFSPYAQYMRKIVLIPPMPTICARSYFSPMRNICVRFAQDCTYFPNAQCMPKICARLYLFLQCAIQGVPKNLLESREQCIVGSPFNFVFFWVSDKTQNKCSKECSNSQLLTSFVHT